MSTETSKASPLLLPFGILLVACSVASLFLFASHAHAVSTSCTVVINAPDVTAAATSYTAQAGSPYVWANTPFSFSAPVSNIGNATASSFPNSFWIENVALFAANALSLGVGAGGTMSGSYTFGTPGSYNIRGCADLNTGWGGALSESNEGNNCGAWTALQVAPATPTNLVATCNANGTAVNISWNAPAGGAAAYYARMQPNTGGACPSGWQVTGWAPPGCIPNSDIWYGTTISNFPTTPGQAYAFWVHGRNLDGSWGPSAGVNFTCTGAPDLTAGAITPTSATYGSAVTLSSTISNSGTATTGAGFTNLFQRATDASGTGLADIGTHAAATLANGATTPATLSYTFPSPATWYVRVCADKASAAGTGTITESNEGNNCSAWTAVTVAAPDLTANPSWYTVQAGSPYVWAGQVFTYNASSTNIGNATATSFPNIFHFENWGQIPATTLTLAPSASGALTGTTAIGTAGVYRVRACADNNISWVGNQTESNESNNCGAYYTFSVAPAIPTGLNASCNANGTSATLSWTAVPNTAFYYVRVIKPTGSACPAGWMDASWAPTTTCVPNPDSVAGTSIVYPSTPGFASTFSVHSAIANGTWSPSASTNFTCNGSSDLTAVNLIPASGSSLTAGGSISFQGRIDNLGNAAASNVPNILQIESNGLIAAAPTPASIAAGGNTTVSASYTFPNTGTFPRTERYRFCADNNTSWVGTNTESNEGNNCAAYTSVTLNALPPTASLSCVPASCTVPVGNTVTLNYTCGNSTSGTLTLSASPLSPFPTGSKTASVAGGYTLSCVGVGPSSPATDVETVVFTVPTVDISAAPERVNPNGSTNISWVSSADITDCTITRDGAAFSTGANGTAVPATNITHSAVFSASCTSGGIPGAATDSVIVNTSFELEEF